MSAGDQLLDVERLAACPAIARVEYFRTIGSTQDRAHELAREADSNSLPLLIVAEEQTAGRGRGANRWWTGPGSLAMSLMFDPANWSLPERPVPQRALITGLAIVDAVQPLLSGRRVGLHWPNDVFVDGKKIAGILVDVLGQGRHVVGIGLNVNNPLAGAPEEVRNRAASLCELAGRTFDRTEVLLSLIEQLHSGLRAAAAAPEEIGARFQELCLQVDRMLTIDSAGQVLAGRCAGIATDGALLLDTSNGRQRVYSGVLRHDQ